MSLAAGVEGSSPVLNIGIFLVFVIITLVIVVRVSKRATSGASDFYTAGGGFTGQQNGIAISGDYLSAASFLGIAGAIALYGYDGFLYSIGFLVAWLVALLLVAELLRNTGRFTMGDVLAFRMRQRPVRAAAATSTLAVSFFYLLAQMAGAGGLVALLLDVTSKAGQSLVIAVVGAVMIAYVLIGGMRGTTWVQIIKAVLLIIGAAVMTIWVLALYGFNFSALLGDAVAKGGEAGAKLLGPGAQYGKSGITKLDFISLALALVLGTAGLPHILMRFYTVPTAREARRSVQWAIGLIGLFYLFTLVLGYGAAALVGPAAINAAPGKANSAAPLLAYELGGDGAARPHRRSGVRDDPRGRRRSDDHRVGVVRARHLRQRDQARRGGRQERGGQGRAHHRGRDRHRGDPRRHPRQRAEHRVPRGARVRGRRVGQPADDPLLAVLEAFQHRAARCGASTAAWRSRCC